MRRALHSIRSALAVTVKSKQSSKLAKQASPAVKQAPKVILGGMHQVTHEVTPALAAA